MSDSGSMKGGPQFNSRNVVNRGACQQLPDSRNPAKHSAGRLEGTGYAFGGPSRNTPNHTNKVSRNWHTNSGNTRKADGFKGRRP